MGGEILRTRPDWPRGPHSLLYNAYRFCSLGVKKLERGIKQPHPSSAEVKERVDLYLCFPSRPSCPVVGMTFTFTFTSCNTATVMSERYEYCSVVTGRLAEQFSAMVFTAIICCRLPGLRFA